MTTQTGQSDTQAEPLSIGVDLINTDGEPVRALAEIEVPQEDVVRLTARPLDGRDSVTLDLSAMAAKEIGDQLRNSGVRAWPGI